MVNASKILTVSYGTFSCTLEGFDDPFSTMRSIAEYFRDLAADDRYFGAEPPTPDAEMLHRIAEREIKRRVEAKVQKNGVVLRQIADENEAGAAPTQAEPVHSSAPMAAATVASATAPPHVTQDVAANPADAATVESVAEKLRRIRAAVARTHAEPQLGSIFVEDERPAELFRAGSIDAAFNAEPEVEVAKPETPADTSEFEEEPAAAEASEQPAEASLAEADETPEADDIGERETTAHPNQAEADSDQPEVAEQDAPEEFSEFEEDLVTAEAVEEPAEDGLPEIDETSEADEFAETADTSDAEELLADGEEQPLEAEPTEDEDLAPEAERLVDEDESALDLAEADEAVDAELDTVETDEAETDETPDTSEDDIIGNILASGPTDEAEFEEDIAPAAETGEAGDDLDLSQLFDQADEAEEPEATFAEDESQPDVSEAEAEDSKLVLSDADRAEDTAADDEQPVIRAEVVKMSRAEFEIQYGTADQDQDEGTAEAATDQSDADDADEIRKVLGDTGLSAEDEADLISELVEVERGSLDHVEDAEEVLVDDAEDASDTEEAAEGAAPDQAAIAASLAAVVDQTRPRQDAGDLSVDRLLAQADTRLQDNDGSRRRSAIAHLKAAVAAVRADGGKVEQQAAAEDAKTLDRYRSDLAKVVRPEPKSAVVADMKAAAEANAAQDADTSDDKSAAEPARRRRRMPPLMLVSEQRIDKPISRDPSAGPVRPRRVQTDDDAELENELFEDTAEGKDPSDAAGNMFRDVGDFSSYVAETGAEGIQELLEASVAFGTLIEGHPFNTRPQIMQRMLRFVPEGSVTREEGLRAFGVLLREGRIHRIQRGQFMLPANSRFHVEKRTAIM